MREIRNGHSEGLTPAPHRGEEIAVKMRGAVTRLLDLSREKDAMMKVLRALNFTVGILATIMTWTICTVCFSVEV